MRAPAGDGEMFKGRHFDRQVIILCVRWYLSFKLSSRDLVEMMAERGIELAHTTILRWVQRYVPEFEKRWSRYARTVGGSWRCDETYIKVNGGWTYLYRAVDKQGRTVDFWLSEQRDVAGQSILSQVYEAEWSASGHYPGCLRRFTPRHRRPEGRGEDAEASSSPFE